MSGYTYESALKEEKELEEKIRAELYSLGKPELMEAVKEYAAITAIRLAIAAFKGK